MRRESASPGPALPGWHGHPVCHPLAGTLLSLRSPIDFASCIIDKPALMITGKSVRRLGEGWRKTRVLTTLLFFRLVVRHCADVIKHFVGTDMIERGNGVFLSNTSARRFLFL